MHAPGPPSPPQAAGSSASVKYNRVLAASFDSLVRSTRAGSNATPAIARRTLEAWQEHPSAVLQLHPAVLEVDGEAGIETGESEGRWLLPAFMAGLRTLALRADAGAWDVLRLAAELGQLDPRPDALAAFRDWLWSDGAEGFEVGMQISFMEVLEAADTTAAWDDWSAAAVRSLSGSMLADDPVKASARDLDHASLREPFQMSLSLFQKSAREGAGRLTPEQVEALRGGADLGLAWADAEMDAVLNHPELRGTIPPDRLARRIVSLLQAQCDIRLVEFLTMLTATDDAYARSVVGALENEPLGEILAAQVPLDGPGTSALGHCLARAPRAIASGLMHGLLARCVADAAAAEALFRVAQQGSADRMIGVLDPARLTPGEAPALARLLASVRGGTALLRGLAGTCPLPVRSALLAGLPPSALAEEGEQVHALLRQGPPEDNARLLAALAGSRDPRCLALLAEAVKTSHGAGWSPRLLRTCCEALLDTPTGCEAVAALARSPSADPDTRLLALRVLERKPEWLKRVSRWSLREALLDPPEVRDRLREARGRAAREEEA